MQKRERAGELPIIWTLGALLAVGALIRSWAYARRGALWTDEAGLALNFVGRGFDQIARPFVYDQYAPYLYLLGDKLITLTLGVSEQALRFGSLIGGILLLPCVALLAARVLDRRAALFALAILASNWLTIEYSTELKPYILDAVVTAWLGLLTVPVISRSKPRLWPLGVVGAIAPWLSLPAIFTLAAVGAALLLDGWTRRLGVRELLLRCALGGGWLVSFAIHYFTFLNAESNSTYLQSYWAAADAFGPFPPHSLSDVRWYFAKFFYLFNVLVCSGGFGLRYVTAIGWLAGMYLLWRQNRALPALFGVPVLLLFIASAIHKYIVADRMVLFLGPHLIVPVAVALARLARAYPAPLAAAAAPDFDPPLIADPPAASAVTRSRASAWRSGGRPLLAAGLAAAACLTPIPDLNRHLENMQPDGPDIRSALEHLKEQYRPGDALYVEQQVEWIYAFYARREAFKAPFVLSDARGPDRTAALKPLDDLQGSRRVWVLLPALGRAHLPNPRAAPSIAKAEHVVTQHLDQIGRRVGVVDADNIHLYLYDLSKSVAVH